MFLQKYQEDQWEDSLSTRLRAIPLWLCITFIAKQKLILLMQSSVKHSQYKHLFKDKVSFSRFKMFGFKWFILVFMKGWLFLWQENMQYEMDSTPPRLGDSTIQCYQIFLPSCSSPHLSFCQEPTRSMLPGARLCIFAHCIIPHLDTWEGRRCAGVQELYNMCQMSKSCWWNVVECICCKMQILSLWD